MGGAIGSLLAETLGMLVALMLLLLMALPAFVLMVTGVFVLALIDPNSPVFHTEDFDGAGFVHFFFLPLFILVFSGIWVYLIKDRPRREREWRQLFAQYKNSLTESPNPDS